MELEFEREAIAEEEHAVHELAMSKGISNKSSNEMASTARARKVSKDFKSREREVTKDE